MTFYTPCVPSINHPLSFQTSNNSYSFINPHAMHDGAMLLQSPISSRQPNGNRVIILCIRMKLSRSLMQEDRVKEGRDNSKTSRSSSTSALTDERDEISRCWITKQENIQHNGFRFPLAPAGPRVGALSSLRMKRGS